MKWCIELALCLVFPVTVAQEPAAAQSPPAPLSHPVRTALDDLFFEIVDEARQIERMLSEVTDKESADRSASLLEHTLVLMDSNLRRLEKLSFRHEPETAALKANMATLTHISQNYLAAMQRLAEVNAYGSEPLLALFIRYKMDGEKPANLQAEDMPHTQLYGELADTMEDAIYTLGCIQSAEEAAAAVPRLRNMLRTSDRAHHLLAQLVPPTTEEQRDAVQPARDKLRALFFELK